MFSDVVNQWNRANSTPAFYSSLTAEKTRTQPEVYDRKPKENSKFKNENKYGVFAMNVNKS